MSIANAAHCSMIDGGKKAPTGHQVEYIDIGGYYFEPNYKPNSSTTLEAEFAYLQSASNRGQVDFGTRDGWQNKAFVYPAGRPADRSTWPQWGNTYRSYLRLPAVTLGAKVKIGVGLDAARAFSYNGRTTWTPSAATFQCSYNFCINETLEAGIPIESTIFCEMRLFYCKLRENGVLKVDVVPWVEDNTATLKDLVSGKILTPKLASNQTYARYLTPGPIAT